MILGSRHGDVLVSGPKEPRMLRYVCAVVVAVIIAFANTPASAVTPEAKMETCKFGADADKLTGAKRKRFLSRCMADTEAPGKSAKKQQTK
jgi:hypothetical protein